jgi:pimeloyl-ACP methyl ester carboxylesterase
MHTAGKIEDRVFGMSNRLPPLPIVTRESTEYDLLSVSVDGAEVAYAQQGRVALPPLVMLHGWAASHKFWKYSFSAFSPRWRVIAPDLVGFGISEKPKRDYSLEGLTTWFGRFLDAMKLDRITLVAHSMGGTIALLYAIQHPERIERLVVSNPVIVGETAFTGRTKLCMAPGIKRILFSLANVGWIRRWVARDFTVIGQLDDDLSLDVTKGTYQSMFDSLRSTAKADLRGALSSLAVPTLSIGTEKDLLVAPDQYALVPAQKKVSIPDTGHIPMIERPEVFNQTLNEFLTGTSTHG